MQVRFLADMPVDPDPIITAALERGLGLDRDAAQRSIAIDFEGPAGPTPKSPPPAADLLGWRLGHRGAFHGCILNPDLHFLANGRRELSKHLEAGSLAETMHALVDLAEKEDRVLLHFSGHEIRILARHLSAEDFERCCPRLVDGRKLVLRHLNRTRPGAFAETRFSLENAAAILCPRLQAGQPSAEPGRTLRDLRQWASKRKTRRISKLGDGRLTRWLTLLEYNFYDLKMLHRCATTAAGPPREGPR